jgi:hypothetical protein
MTVPRERSEKKKRIFNPQTKWRREIESHARDVGAGDTDDLSRWLVAWVWFNKSKDPPGAVIECARTMGRKGFTAAEARDVIQESKATLRAMPPGSVSKDNIADTVGRFLRVDYATRQRLHFTKIGSWDVDREGRLRRRKERQRQADKRRRRQRGAKTRAEYLEANSISRTKRWKSEGISRAQWYRRQKARQVTNETGPITAVLLNAVRTLVSSQ